MQKNKNTIYFSAFNLTACLELLKPFCHKPVQFLMSKLPIEKFENRNTSKDVHITQIIFVEWGVAGRRGQRRKSEHRNKQHNRIM